MNGPSWKEATRLSVARSERGAAGRGQEAGAGAGPPRCAEAASGRTGKDREGWRRVGSRFVCRLGLGVLTTELSRFWEAKRRDCTPRWLRHSSCLRWGFGGRLPRVRSGRQVAELAGRDRSMRLALLSGVGRDAGRDRPSGGVGEGAPIV